ncbi:MAG: hypothetical protein LBL96_10500 [Clostridiales bacterium]|jgi:hypothetical protein|nr:hypothetical protein [Clostridiales bacterium]
MISEKIEKAYQEMSNSTMDDHYENSNMPDIIKELFVTMIEIISAVDFSKYFFNVAKFEILKLMGSFEEDIIYKFDVNILKILKGDKNIEYTPCWVRVINNNGKIRIKKVKFQITSSEA